jgi:Dolichyl-phosphate-mannose-protein mannosyltransferase
MVDDLLDSPALIEQDTPPRSEDRTGMAFRKLGSRSLLLAVVGTAVAVRLPAVGFGLPGLNHPDEPVNVDVGIAMVEHATVDPHFFAYPSLMFDVIAAGAWVQRLLTGHPVTSAAITRVDTGIGHTSDPHLFLALRLFSLLLSVGACALVYVALARITRRGWIAASASATLAVSPLLVANGVYVAPDVYCEFWAAAALLGSLAVARRALPRDYLLTGVAVGLAIGSKFNAAPLVVAVLVAHVAHHRGAAVRWRGVGAALCFVGAACVAFIVTSPASVLDTHAFVTGALAEVRHYSSGHPGVTGSASGFYLRTLFEDSPFLLVGAGAAVLALVGGYRTYVMVVGSYSLSYAVLIGTQVVFFSRNTLPLYPALAVLLGLAVATVADGVEHRPHVGHRGHLRARNAIAVLAVLAVLAPPLVASLSVPTTLDNTARAQALAWLRAHVPEGSTVVVDSYGPWLGGDRYHVDYAVFAIGQALPANAAAILLTEQGSGRFADPGLFPVQAAEYAAVRDTYCTAASFEGGPWVDVLVPCRS